MEKETRGEKKRKKRLDIKTDGGKNKEQKYGRKYKRKEEKDTKEKK